MGNVYKLCRVYKIHSNGRVLGIGQVTVWTSHAEFIALGQAIVMHLILQLLEYSFIYHVNTSVATVMLLIIALLITCFPCMLLSTYVLTPLLSMF